MTAPMEEPGGTPLAVREATEDDATGVRRVVTEALLAAGFPPPDEERDQDLVHFGFYRERGRAAWVATTTDGRVVGCAAVDHGEDGQARLRRFAGRGLDALAAEAVAFARGQGYAGIEAVIAPGTDAAREAVEAAGFSAAGAGNELLYRRTL
ncbi:MAG: hypothetical protein GEU80_03845 [Dehalococcoidia bacterium]|nr:hypothetical protein [Dehalococcoidia bacterium]